jgi:VIT1/CCC1 family predicted Fe2+/Mn2+ transporter
MNTSTETAADGTGAQRRRRSHGYHSEQHRTGRLGWLRAAVLGANDGIVSTSSLIVGVVASGAGPGTILMAGTAGLVAGAMSMAAGEFVSVSSQADAEQADLEIERREIEEDHEYERRELADIYVARGVSPELALQVADQLMAHDALEAHARDELGISDLAKARPVEAALSSAVAFAAGAAVPLFVVLAAPQGLRSSAVAGATLASLGLLGTLAAAVAGAPVLRGALRVVLWGAGAMALTAVVGRALGGAG